MHPFHVVRHANHGKTVTYTIYVNNEPFLLPAKDKWLRKRAAYGIAKLLNSGVVFP